MPFPTDCPYTDWHEAGYHYQLTKVPGYEDFCGRVVIEWGKAPIAFCFMGVAWVGQIMRLPDHGVPPAITRAGRLLRLFM